MLSQIEPFVYEWTASCKGSVSAEHGLGVMKAHALGYTKSAAAVGGARFVLVLSGFCVILASTVTTDVCAVCMLRPRMHVCRWI